MITNDDIEFMQIAREEMLNGRKFEVELILETSTNTDPDTGESLTLQLETITIAAHVTENPGRQLQIDEGILSTIADIKVDVNIDDWQPASFFTYSNKKYRVIGMPEKGIGQRNRVEVFGELVH
ncbi:hypothetical protein LL50_05570 [Listeria monocytogenes]|nr:hypothetical protein [Listeria monocytogenes]EAD0383075.1 hypothetical protein [Listeria monocytogenes]EAD9128490.1 hypothetical protein [Listeria monocytogenes]EAF2023418.1 hypothetical protein [Listeria monocytogenes]